MTQMYKQEGRLYNLAHWAAHHIPGFRAGAMMVVSPIWKVWGSWRLWKAYRRALHRGEIIRLHIGAGSKSLPGWFNTDVTPVAPFYLDATKPFPLDSNSVRYIFSEDFIEHISLSDAIAFLKESFRVLDWGGVIRIATPDLEAHSKEYLAQSSKARLLLDRNKQIGYEYGPALAAIMNKMFYADQHRYIYDRDTLEYMLRQAGFTSIVSCKVRESLDPELRELEQHDVGSVHDAFFTLVVEAKKGVNQAAKASMP